MPGKSGHHRSGGAAGRWQGWNRQAGSAPVTVRHVEPTAEVEPMTEAQESFLRLLCEELGEEFNSAWGKRSATKRIDTLKRKRRAARGR